LQPAGELGSGLNRETLDGQEWKLPDPVQTIRVLDFLETRYLSGPAKNLIEFATRSAQPNRIGLHANIAVATFHRGNGSPSNDFTIACSKAELRLHVVQEKFAYDPTTVSRMRNLIDSHNPHIIQTHSVKSHFLLRMTGAYRRHHWIAFHHGYTWTDLKVRLYNQLDRWSLPASSRVITVCRAFASELNLIGVPMERIAIQHNAVKPFVPASAGEVAKLRERFRIPPDARILLNIGRLSCEKGQTELLNALAILRRQNIGVKFHLVLVGDGPDRQKLERTASRCGIADLITFASYQPAVSPYYTLADVMVLPSQSEGSPNVLLEAMAAGLPIVATRVGGVPEIVSDAKAALLVPARDPAALAQGIAKVLDDRDFSAQLSVAAKKTAAAYSPQSYCESMLELYRDCMKQEPAKYRKSGNHQPREPEELSRTPGY